MACLVGLPLPIIVSYQNVPRVDNSTTISFSLPISKYSVCPIVYSANVNFLIFPPDMGEAVHGIQCRNLHRRQ